MDVPRLHRRCGTVLVWLGASLSVGATAAPAAAPLLVHQGQRIEIPANSPLRSRVHTAAVTDSALPDHVPVQAVVEADPARAANVLAPFTGRLLHLDVALGDRVAKGQAVAELSAPDLTQAYADLDKARDMQALAKRSQERARAVLEAGGSAAKDLELADSAAAQADAEATRARARIKALGLDPDAATRDATVHLAAPIAGTVTAIGSAAGGYVTDQTAALLTITNLDQLWVSAQVPEHLIAQIRPGIGVDVRLAAYPDALLHGRVETIAATLDADTRRTRARIPFANREGRLRPNMFATAIFSVPQARAVRVPQSALVLSNDVISVYVEVAPWVFERRNVELGTEDAQGARVLHGLQAGERIVTAGAVLLND